MHPSKIFTRLCWEMGFIVIKRRENPIPVLGQDPRELPYLKKLPFTLMELPLALGVGLRFYPLSSNTHHPFILALFNRENRMDPKSNAFEILRKYSELVNVKNANDFLGLTGEEAIFPKDSHPYEFTYPWSSLSPREMKNNYRGYFSKENRKFDLKSDECLESAYVSDEKIHLEVSRLLDLKLSIQSHGYQSGENEVIGATVFVRDGKWRWCVEGGQHRAAVVAALGMEKVPVYVKRIVRREDVKVWCGVQRKIYSSQSALKLFDRIFDLEPPFTAKDWVDYVNENLGEKADLKVQQR